MSTSMSAEPHSGLADPALRRALVDYVKRRVAAGDVEDVVQTVLVDALEAKDRPAAGDPLRRWLLGVARHKVVDLHRRRGRETVTGDPDADVPDPAHEPPVEERALAAWAEKQIGEKPDARQTLEILAREGEGEKLEAIAADEKLPPATVRQRVSRMRRFLRERWKAEIALVAALGVLALVVWRLVRGPELPEAQREPTPEPSAEPVRRAAELRREAGKRCDEGRWVACLRGLDDAKALDPEGDRAPEIGALRKRAEDALRPAPAPSVSARPDLERLNDPTPVAPQQRPDEKQEKKSPEPKPAPTNVKPSPKDLEPKAPSKKDAPSKSKSGGSVKEAF